MVFASPWILLTLVALPLLWWLLRVSPPAPRSQIFPALRLLIGLDAREETPARTPPWLLLLRMVAAGLIIVGLARPVLDAGTVLAGRGIRPVSYAEWLRIEAAESDLATALGRGERVKLHNSEAIWSACRPRGRLSLGRAAEVDIVGLDRPGRAARRRLVAPVQVGVRDDLVRRRGSP